ncbi:lysine decarboxylase-like protein-like protein [Trichodelitschia bisporula]|uniref:Lysine decarboxylase-like protein-like protein n=1 Tax=Trichodelitschia bisporula TaxID=703511 RepID=A0A6G1HQE8_9PEZI|nr:lysine decarboxylase-like protein-like protein [Trichodelitschia bisporula]
MTLPESASDGNQPVVCVFCGSKPGAGPKHLAAARNLAQTFHEHGIKLVYGGGTVGIMGELARTLVSLSGPDAVHGIIPAPLVAYEQGTDANNPAVGNVIDEAVYGRTTVVKDMHTRKQMMAQEVIAGGSGSGFVAMSGGYGTLEEIMEITTWNQLGIHDRGVIMFNVDGYWDGIMQWIRTAVSSEFITPVNGGIVVEARNTDDVVTALRDYKNSEGRLNLQWTAEG